MCMDGGRGGGDFILTPNIDPEPGSKSWRSYFRIKVEILGQYELGYNIFQIFLIKINGVQGTVDRWKSGYFSVMKHFGFFIILTRDLYNPKYLT